MEEKQRDMGVVRPNAQCGIACVQDLACGQALAQVTYVTISICVYIILLGSQGSARAIEQ